MKKLSPVDASAKLEALASRRDAIEQHLDRDRKLERHKMHEQQHCDQRRALAGDAEHEVGGDDDQGARTRISVLAVMG